MIAQCARISWFNSPLMLGTLCAGILLGLDHLLFSQSLAGRPVTTENFNIIDSPVSRQQANIAIENGFPVLVKVSLALAV